VLKFIGRLQLTRGLIANRVVDQPNSKCAEQYCANEQKHSAHRQHIELQGKVHVRASHLVEMKA
jgi:hypothetical protein